MNIYKKSDKMEKRTQNQNEDQLNLWQGGSGMFEYLYTYL